ncbi:glycosyltransferase family 1 protein [Clavibacter michiganensis]|uniref:glycosyltransferase n=1 Tax=Clavibacter michiganensis TaxID=28447 RepID=UPI000CE79213|nr:glycosyltransferase [Clavibacter michiganensis]PPF55793.1 glycosyltransferase family 1 protein [Clavibacter michiganensis]
MRIAFVSLHTSPIQKPSTGDAGGLNVYLLELARSLGRQGHEVRLITRATDPADPAVVPVAPGVELISLRAGPAGPLAKEELPAVTDAFAAALAALPPADVVHAHYWLSAVASLPVARAWGVPHVLTLHSVSAGKNRRLVAGDTPEPASRLADEGRLVRASDLVVASAESEKRLLVEAYGAAPAAVHVVAPGVEAAFLQEPSGRDGGRVRIVLLGRIQPLKGQDVAVRALALLDPATRPLLVIAGGVSPGRDAYADGLHGLVRSLGLQDDVVFTGALDRAATARALAAAHLALMPSAAETYGLVALEAAACGTPVVASRTEGLVDSVREGVSGVFVPTREPAEWARAIRGLLADPAALARLSASAREHAARHTWDVAAADVAEEYRLLRERRSRETRGDGLRGPGGRPAAEGSAAGQPAA